MPGPAPKPPDQRVTRHKPQRGDWRAAEATGWQHGKVPRPPAGLGRDAKAAWKEWFGTWVASFWRPEDVQALRAAILLYDAMLERPSASTATALGQYLDRFGLTPKGLQDRRWSPPDQRSETQPAETPTEDPYRGLRVVGE